MTSLNASRVGEFSTPIRLVIAVMLIMIILVVVVSIARPNLFQFSGTSNQTIFDTLKNIGGFIGETGS